MAVQMAKWATPTSRFHGWLVAKWSADGEILTFYQTRARVNLGAYSETSELFWGSSRHGRYPVQLSIGPYKIRRGDTQVRMDNSLFVVGSQPRIEFGFGLVRSSGTMAIS
jgi:hypothetical protein